MEPIFTIRFCGHALNVTKECIGINSMVSMLALSVVLAAVRRMPFLQSSLLFACGAILAVAQNIFRILIILVVSVFSYETATGVVHDMCGYFTFMVASLVLDKACERIRMSRCSKNDITRSSETERNAHEQ